MWRRNVEDEVNALVPDERIKPAAEGARYFELPFSAVPGRLTNPELGICSVVQRAGEHKPYEMIVTVLDTPDHRLVRSGVWLAHRVVAERGEWYLSAPSWTPWLPEEEVEPLDGDGDLPERFAELVLPFRRGAALGPVAAMTCRREEFALRDAQHETLAVLRSEQVTVRVGGLTTARYREITVTPVEGRLNARQMNWISESLILVGGSRVESLPTTAQRLGAPASGLTDLPLPSRCGRDDTLEAYVSSLLASRVRALTLADVELRAASHQAVNSGQQSVLVEKNRACAQLADQLVATQAMLRGLGPLWEASWKQEVDDDLTWILESMGRDEDAQLAPQLSGTRYLGVLDRLVVAVRAPLLVEHALDHAGPVLDSLLARRVNEFRVRARALNDHSSDESWFKALTAGQGVLDCCLVQPAQTKGLKRLQRWTRRFVDGLVSCSDPELPRLISGVATLTPAEAFDSGRTYEQRWSAQEAARVDFRDHWQRRGSRVQLPAAK